MTKILKLLTSLLLGVFLFISPAQAVPPIMEAKLDNGLHILLMEAHNVPMVAMQLTIVAGSRFDAAGKGGSASLLASMLSDHTGQHDHEAWAALLDSEAIQLGAGVDRDGMSISMTVLKEVLPTGIEAFSDALLNTGWNKERFKLIKENAISAAQKAQEEPRTKASEASSELLFPGHPYGHRPKGSLATLKNIQLADLKALYRAQVWPQEAVLAVSGDITMPELLALLKPALKNWNGAPEESLLELGHAESVHGTTRLIEMQTSQTLSQLVRLGPARKDSAFFPVFVLNHILGGGGFGSRLMEEVREKRGLVYGVYSYFVPLAAPGPFFITLQTRANQAKDAEDVVSTVMQELFDGNINAKQLREAKSNLTGSFAQRMDSNRERVGLMSMIGFYEMPLDYLQVWTEKVDSVTLVELKAAAKTYLNPEQWNLVRVGPNTPKNAPEKGEKQ
jgi:zinc protease